MNLFLKKPTERGWIDERLIMVPEVQKVTLINGAEEVQLLDTL